MPEELERPDSKEFKTIACECGASRIFLHFRGHQKFEKRNVKEILRNMKLRAKDFMIMNPDDLLAEFGVEKGEVGPFIAAQSDENGQKVIHIFDEGLFEKYSHNERMMTNGGCPELGMEFAVCEAFDFLRAKLGEGKVLRANIVRGGIPESLQTLNQLWRRKIGVVVYGPEAVLTTFRKYFQEFFQQNFLALREKNFVTGKDIPVQSAGTSSMPEISWQDKPQLALCMDLQNHAQEVLAVLRETVAQFKALGIDEVVIPCNILPIFEPQLREDFPQMNFISIVDGVRRELAAVEGAKFVLGGSQVASEGFGIYRDVGNAHFPNQDQAKAIDGLMFWIDHLQDPKLVSPGQVFLDPEQSMASLVEAAMPDAQWELRKQISQQFFKILVGQEFDHLVVASTSISRWCQQNHGEVVNPAHCQQSQFSEVARINASVLDTLQMHAKHFADSLFQKKN